MKVPTKKHYFKTEAFSSIEMFHKAIEFVNFFGRALGCNIFSNNFSIFNPMMLVSMIDLSTYLLISFQNIYAFRDDFVRVVFCIVTLGMGFQCVNKVYTFIIDRKQTLKLALLIESFHETASCEKASKSFEKWILIFCHVESFGLVLFFGCGFLVFCYPIIYYLITWKKILHFGFIIPGIDWTTLHGYSLNFLHHSFQIYCVINAVFMTSSYTILFMMNAFAQYDSLQNLLDTLSNLAVSNKKFENNSKIKTCISDITNGHVKLQE